jgi:sec-independent protein translocase protein TatA
MFEGLTPTHLILVLAIALVVLGPGKLPEAGAALGRSIRLFRDAATGDPKPVADAAPASAPVPDAPASGGPGEGQTPH